MTSLALNRRAFLAAGLLVLAPGSKSRGHNGTIHVSIEDLAFVPTDVQAAVGERIEWTNHDPFDHTATVKGGWEIVIPAGQVATRIVEAEDTVEYYCRYHPNMTGTIRVRQRAGLPRLTGAGLSPIAEFGWDNGGRCRD